jgi:hypothetical protein
MKKAIFTISTTLAILFFLGCAKETTKLGDNLPAEIKNYLTTHYPEQSITKVDISIEDSSKTYEIKLANLTELEFNANKEIVDIIGKTELPSSVVHEKIRTYVILNYPINFIVGWELDEGKQEVELNNSVDLEFDNDNNFLRVDTTP